MQVFDELVDQQRSLIVAQSDCVASKAGLLTISVMLLML